MSGIAYIQCLQYVHDNSKNKNISPYPFKLFGKSYESIPETGIKRYSTLTLCRIKRLANLKI